MHFLFNLLRIKGLYRFRALLAHPQEALHQDWGGTPILVHARKIPTVCEAPPEDERVVLETCRGG
jgi:hypothetical protein